MSNLVLPLLIFLSKDENLTVRRTCLEALLDVAHRLRDSETVGHVGEIIVSLVKFGLSSKTVAFMSTIALRLSDLCHTLESE